MAATTMLMFRMLKIDEVLHCKVLNGKAHSLKYTYF
jgi:hypothetical protein